MARSCELAVDVHEEVSARSSRVTSHRPHIPHDPWRQVDPRRIGGRIHPLEVMSAHPGGCMVAASADPPAASQWGDRWVVDALAMAKVDRAEERRW